MLSAVFFEKNCAINLPSLNKSWSLYSIFRFIAVNSLFEEYGRDSEGLWKGGGGEKEIQKDLPLLLLLFLVSCSGTTSRTESDPLYRPQPYFIGYILPSWRYTPLIFALLCSYAMTLEFSPENCWLFWSTLSVLLYCPDDNVSRRNRVILLILALLINGAISITSTISK